MTPEEADTLRTLIDARCYSERDVERSEILDQDNETMLRVEAKLRADKAILNKYIEVLTK